MYRWYIDAVNDNDGARIGYNINTDEIEHGVLNGPLYYNSSCNTRTGRARDLLLKLVPTGHTAAAAAVESRPLPPVAPALGHVVVMREQLVV